MTRPEMIAEAMRWDKAAIEQGLFEARRWIWRVMDAIEGRPLDPRAAAWLAEIDQTPRVVAIREALGVSDAPAWERRSA